MAPRGNKRKTRRRRRLSISSSSSSSRSGSSSGSESDHQQLQEPQQKLFQEPSTLEKAASAESDSGASSSSLGLDSSSDEDDSDAEDQPSKHKKPKVDASKGQDTQTAPQQSATPALQQQQSREPVNRERSPSPPLFGFPGLSSSGSSKLPPLLYGHVPGDNQTTQEKDQQRQDPQAEELRQFYLDKVVNRFDKQLDELRQEQGISDRLELLINSLSQGAQLLSTAAAADAPSSIWHNKDGSPGERDILLSLLHKKKQAGDLPAASASANNGEPSSQAAEEDEDGVGDTSMDSS